MLPKSVRDGHRWEAGTEFDVEDRGDGVFLRPIKALAPTRLEDVFGCLRYTGKPKSIAEMDAAIDEEVRRRRDRGRY